MPHNDDDKPTKVPCPPLEDVKSSDQDQTHAEYLQIENKICSRK